MTTHLQTLILGYGEMGHAMEHLLLSSPAVKNIAIWEKYPLNGFSSVILENAVPEADIIIFCLPVSPYHEVLNAIKPLLKHDSICIGLAKGLDKQGHSAAQIFLEVLKSEYNYALLYGPMISEEIRAGRYAFAQVLCESQNTYERVRDLFSNPKISLKHSEDIIGASWTAILKNVYAILFGITDELKCGDNVRGFLAAACLEELEQVIYSKGGLAGTAYQWAGLADLITTATSPHSHHYTLGRRLGRGENVNISGEGVHTLRMIEQHQLFNIQKYPLIKCVDACVNNAKGRQYYIDALLKTAIDYS